MLRHYFVRNVILFKIYHASIKLSIAFPLFYMASALIHRIIQLHRNGRRLVS